MLLLCADGYGFLGRWLCVSWGRLEVCGDGKDNNCDGVVDEVPCLIDDDGDGYFTVLCDDTITVDDCSRFKDRRRVKRNNEDCNDHDANISPVATEICGDGIDQNCDGKDYLCPGDDVPPTESPSSTRLTSSQPTSTSGSTLSHLLAGGGLSFVIPFVGSNVGLPNTCH